MGLALASLVSMPPALPAAGSAGEARHSGQVLAVGDDVLVLQEIVAWTGPGAGFVTRRLRLTPVTSSQLGRGAETIDPDRWPVVFDEQPLAADAIRRGDFVTVTTRRAQGDTAVSLEVWRPAG